MLLLSSANMLIIKGLLKVLHFACDHDKRDAREENSLVLSEVCASSVDAGA